MQFQSFFFHSMPLNAQIKMFSSSMFLLSMRIVNVVNPGKLLDLLENSQCCKSWETCSFEFNCFSIDSHCVLVRGIPFGPQLFRTISGVLGINYQIRIRFSSSRIFKSIRIFGVFVVQMTCNVIVHVLVLWLVCTHTISFRMLFCLWWFMITCRYTYVYIYGVSYRHMWTCNEYVYISVQCFYSSSQGPPDGELSLRCATAGEKLVEQRYWRAIRSFFLEKRCERQTEPPSGWFPTQCPSGELELNNFIK